MSEPRYTLSVSAGGIALLGAGLQALNIEINRLTLDLNAQIAAQDLVAQGLAQAPPEPDTAPIPVVRAPQRTDSTT